MPLSSNRKVHSKPLTAAQSFASDPEAGQKMLVALADIQEGIEGGNYLSVILGTVFKSDELQLAIQLGKSKWKNIDCDNYVDALLNYFDLVELELPTTPPSPPSKGGQGKEPR